MKKLVYGKSKIKKVFILMMLVVMIGTTNIFVSNLSTTASSNKTALTLANVTLLNYANAEVSGNAPTTQCRKENVLKRM